MKRAALAVLAVALAFACHGERRPAASPGGAAPVTPRGTVVLEPPRIEVGDTAKLVLAVVTPPGWRAEPLPALRAPDGLGIVGVGPMEVERGESRWIHRTPVRVRALRTGAVAWPALTLRFTRPDGGEASVQVPGRPLEVTALLPETGSPERYFSYRLPAPGAARSAGWRILLLAMGVATALVLLAAARRLRAGRSRPAAPASRSPLGAAWRDVEAAIDAAAGLAEREPVRAADLLSTALRRYVADHYGAPTRVATTQELAAGRPPFALTTRWARLVGLLARLDDLRFAPPGTIRGPRVFQRLMDEARSVAGDLAPPGGRP